MPKEHHRTRILHVTFNMGFGGTEQVIRQLVSHLDPNRYECEIACIDGEIGAIGEAMQAELGTTIHSHKRNPGLDWPTVRWLRQLIKNGQFNVVHCHQYSPYVYGWLAHWGTRVRLVFTEHGRFHPDTHRKKARWINPVMALTTSHVVAISSATKDALVEYEYVPPETVKVIYNGISPLAVSEMNFRKMRQDLGIAPEEYVIGTVARLDPVKNQALMLRATRLLRNENLPIRLIIVGDGPELNALQTLTAQLGLGAAVIFTGFQSKAADYLSLMDVFLLPSFTEGTSMTLLEAMSLGIPTVATRVGGNPEIITDGKTGILFESNNLDGLVQALKALISNPERHRQMSKQSRKVFIERFTAKRMAEQYQELYKRNTNH